MHRLDQRLRRLAASVNRLRRKWLSLALLCTTCMLSCLSGRIYAAEDAVFSHKNDAMKIALTFDDGPHAEYTRQILDILDSVTVISFGHKIFEGTPEEMRKDPTVIETYFGGTV